VIKKVWVQMEKLPSELRDYLTIWAIGTILGITKDVDIIFTHQYNCLRMQVLALDPALIPTIVDVVIGDNVYELPFRIEPEGMQEEPKPLYMVDDNDEFDKKEEGGEGDGEQGDFMQEDKNLNSESGRKFGDHPSGAHDGKQGKKAMQLADATVNNLEKEVLHRESWDSDVHIDETEAYSEEELMGDFDEEGKGDELASLEAAQLRELAAISEAETPPHKSKRRAHSGDGHSLDKATRIKAARNLDFTKENSNSSCRCVVR
jgi:hypothetical protein